MNWRIILIRVIVNGVAIALAAVFLPGISVPQPSLVNFLILGFIFGLLNAFVKPVIQFLTISFLFITFGLVIVLVNAVMIFLLALVLPSHLFVVQSFWAAFFAGLIVALITTFLESLLGLTPPVMDKTQLDSPEVADLPLEQPRFNKLMAELKDVKEGVKADETK